KTQTGLDLIQKLQGLGIRVYIDSPPIDTDKSNPMGEFAISMLLAVATLERAMIQERLAAGILARLNANPKWWPGRPPRFGLTTNDAGELIEDPEQAPIVRAMFERAAAGESPGSIRDWLNQRGVQA